MGLFQKLPEDPVEWAGLPSEPLPEETAAQRLADSGPTADVGLGFGDISTIVIPVAPQIEIPASDTAAPADE